MKKIITISVLTIIAYSISAQGGLAWKRTRYELIGGVGAGIFMGDLGGGATTGGSAMDKYFGDIDFISTRPSFMLGLRYKLSRSFSLKGSLTYGWIQADDANSEDPNRKIRNLNFYSYIFEQSMVLEYSIIKENNARRWSKRRNKKIRGFSTNLYAFAGIGGFSFNPIGKYNGQEYELWEIGTTGQQIYGSGKEPYSRYSVCFPYGLGLKVGINKKFDIGIEYGFRYTLTDYIDDAGANYYSNEAILAANGNDSNIGFIVDNHLGGSVFTQADFNKIAAENPNHPYLSAYKIGDRKPYGTGKYDSGSAGVKNGPANDIYMFLFINVSYKLRTSQRGLPKF